MKSEIIAARPGNTKLILIFAGWSTDVRLYEDCIVDGWDTIVVYSYDDFIFNTEILNHYTTVYLYAWSLGVAAAEKVLKDVDITASFAINGTGLPIHDLYGIPNLIFQGTLNNLDSKQLAKFRRRMAASSHDFKILSQKLPQEDNINQLKSQLALFLNSDFGLGGIDWNRVYQSKNDKIFPFDAQNRFWETYHKSTEITILEDEAHYIPLSRIIHSTIHDLNRVAERFKKALPTYDDNATAQIQIIRRLNNLLTNTLENSELKSNEKIDILEIGPGSGAFTKQYAPVLNPSQITYIDLYPIDLPELAAKESLIVADAEQWFEQQARSATPHQFDMIVSSSAIQWFANISRFFHNAAKLLKPEGIFACSTFLPGNLHELNTAGNATMLYHSEEKLVNMAMQSFSTCIVDSETIELDFKYPTSMLRHIANTGVGGSHISRPGAHSFNSLPHTLTYRPVYLICKNR